MLKVGRPEQHRYGFKATGCGLWAEGQGQAQQIRWSFQALQLGCKGSIKQADWQQGCGYTQPQ